MQTGDKRFGYSEEEVISSKVYSSDGAMLSVRPKVEMVKPNRLNSNSANRKRTNPCLNLSTRHWALNPLSHGRKAHWRKRDEARWPSPEFDLFSEKVFAYKQGAVGGSGVGGDSGCN